MIAGPSPPNALGARRVRLWRGLLGVDKRAVIEHIEVAEEGADGAELVVARVRPAPRCVAPLRALRAEGAAPTTGVRAGAAGGGWIGGRCRCGWRPTRRG